MTTLTREQARHFSGRIAQDPAWFCRTVLGCDPYDRQMEMLLSARDHEQTSVVGANSVGKDWMVGRIICWWQSSRYPAKTIITGPTARQVADIVWRETRSAYYSSLVPLGGRMLPVDAHWESADDHFALGFSTDRPVNLTGFHSPNLFVVVTEAHAVSDEHFTMIKRLNPRRLLLTGNAFSASGEFYASHHDKRNLYNALRITAYDSPNVREGRERVPGLVTLRDVERYATDWGEENPLFKATVGAEFVGAPDGLIPLAWLQAAKWRDTMSTDVQPEAGIDVAGPGEDETVLCVRQGPNLLRLSAWTKADPRGEVVAALGPFKGRLRLVKVDSVGIGYNFALHLKDQGFPVEMVNVGEASNHPEQDKDSPGFANLKAELYWGLRERFEGGDVTGLHDETAMAQLSGLRYAHNSRGQVVIERKEDARKRGVKSPDRAEAIMLAFAQAKKPSRKLVSV